MNPSYSGFQAKERKGFLDVPPAGCYEAEILNVRFVPADGGKHQRDTIELFLDISDGEYKGRYMELWNDQKERFGDSVSYKGMFRLTPPVENDEPWRVKAFEENLWCVQESNDGYSWDWDEKKLKGKKVGINVRNHYYTYNGKDRATTEICRFETIADVKAGKCKPGKDRNNIQKEIGTEPAFTDVSATNVDVPW